MPELKNVLWAGRDSGPVLGDWGSRNCSKECNDTTGSFPDRLDARFYDYAKAKPSWPFTPRLNPLHRCWANGVADFPAIAWIGMVPSEHRVDEIALRVEPGPGVRVAKTPCNRNTIDYDSACAAVKDCCSVSPKGVTFNIVYQLFDDCTLEPVGDAVEIAEMRGLNLDAYQFIHGHMPNLMVPPCHTLQVGIQFLSGPNEPSRDPRVKSALGCIPSRITPIIHVTNYDQILQQG